MRLNRSGSLGTQKPQARKLRGHIHDSQRGIYIHFPDKQLAK